jgi:hypothetical protein
MNSKLTEPVMSKKVVSIFFISDFDVRGLLGFDDVGYFHWQLRRLLSGSYSKHRV